MMITKPGRFKTKIRSLLISTFDRIENNNNCNFETNGEKHFLENLFADFSKDKEKKRIIFDVGANIGEYTQMLLDCAEQHNVPADIHVFEPTAKCFEDLEDRFRTYDNVFLNKKGLSDTGEKCLIYYDQEQSGLASLYRRDLRYYNIELSKSEEIETICAVDYIERKKIPHIDYLKVDVEGHELKAFVGFGKYLSSDYIDYIQFEYGGANLDSHTSLMELYTFLEGRGFKVAKVFPKGLEIRSYNPEMENFSYANYVAISNRLLEG
ncbi:MAG TPA: methyltransferase FkbM [Rikenellaceae bacterium]|nr:methyltransferase FkbM [Rikenellaceae bacterium]